MEEKGKYDAQKRYEAKNVVKVLLRLNKKTDADILSHLDQTQQLSPQLKKIIRKGLEAEK